jgi:hypothetical protein
MELSACLPSGLRCLLQHSRKYFPTYLFLWWVPGKYNTRGGPKLALLPGSLILIYHGLEEENIDQKSPGPPGWGLMQRASSSLITKNQEMLKNQTPSFGNQKQRGMAFGFRKTATAAINPDRQIYFLQNIECCPFVCLVYWETDKRQKCSNFLLLRISFS